MLSCPLSPPKSTFGPFWPPKRTNTSDAKNVIFNSYLFQRLIKGITPDIKSTRTKAPAKNSLPAKEIQMSESSARLLKNASFVTNNSQNSSFVINQP